VFLAGQQRLPPPARLAGLRKHLDGRPAIHSIGDARAICRARSRNPLPPVFQTVALDDVSLDRAVDISGTTLIEN